MRKFGRRADHSTKKDGSDLRMSDVVEVPDSISDPDAWLRVMYAPHVAVWEAAGAWFIQMQDDVPLISGAVYRDGKIGPAPKEPEFSPPADQAAGIGKKLDDILAAVQPKV